MTMQRLNQGDKAICFRRDILYRDRIMFQFKPTLLSTWACAKTWTGLWTACGLHVDCVLVLS